MRKLKVVLSDEQGVVLDIAEIEVSDQTRMLSLVPIEGRMREMAPFDSLADFILGKEGA